MDDAAPVDDRAPISHRYPNTPLADRLRVDWLKSLARSGRSGSLRARLFAADRRRRRTRLLRHPAVAGSVTATPRWPPRFRSGLPGRRTPDACDLLFARVDRTRRRHRSPIAARVSGWRSRLATSRLAQAIAVDLPRRRSHRRPRVRRRRPLIRCGRWTEGRSPGTRGGGRDLALYALERAARAPMPDADARPRGSSGATGCRRRTASTATRGLPIIAARQLNPAANDWFARSGRHAIGAGGQQAWRVRAALRGAGLARRAGGDRRACPSRSGRTGMGATGARARLAARGRQAEPRRAARTRCRPRDQFLRRARRRGARRSALRCRCDCRCRRSSSEARGVCRGGADVRRAIKLAGARHAAGIAARVGLRRPRPPDDDALLLAADHARRRRSLRPRDQHRRSHDDVATTMRCATWRRTARSSKPRRRATTSTSRCSTASRGRRSRFATRHRVVGRRGRADAVDAGDGALGRQAAGPHRLSTRSDRRRATLNTQFGAYYFKYWFERARSHRRRWRRPRIMPVPGARRRGARARRSKARSGSRRSRSTKRATT